MRPSRTRDRSASASDDGSVVLQAGRAEDDTGDRFCLRIANRHTEPVGPNGCVDNAVVAAATSLARTLSWPNSV